MSEHSTPVKRAASPRFGVALISVLYFLVVCALTSAAVFFVQRASSRNALASANGTQLFVSAEAALYSALAVWDQSTRSRQAIGTTIRTSHAFAGINSTVFVTRSNQRVFSIVADARATASGIARRVSLLVRIPDAAPRLSGALVSAVGVTIGAQVRFVVDTAACGDTTLATIVLAPGAPLLLDSSLAAGAQPTVQRDSAANDSARYLRIGALWWSDLVKRADIRLAIGAHVTPSPSTAGNECTSNDANWGDPNSLTSLCADRTPLVYAPGDLTIEGGVGQGVLLVDGHLTIAGPFMFSGQIVARHGIETLTDNITISGVVNAWRASADTSASRATRGDVVLAHAVTLRRSRCDAGHGIASWLQPRRVRENAWAELF